MSLLNFKCTRCGQCCSDPSLIVTITHRDLLRFEFFSPTFDLFKIVSFYQVRDADSSLEEKLMTPAIITNHGKTFLGLQRIDDRCIFLENKLCQIYDARPLICHSFPYTFQVRGDQIYWGYALKAKEYCPAIKGKSKIDKTHLEHLASIILKEFEEFRQLIQIWNTLAQNNLIDPSPQTLLSFLTGKIKLAVENLGNMK